MVPFLLRNGAPLSLGLSRGNRVIRLAKMNFRVERDSMGEVRVPADAYYGASTQRAVENFPISRLRFSRGFLEALGEIKRAAAEVNRDQGNLEPGIANAVITAATEVAEGKWDAQFVVDIFQTGSGTSINMNANEIIANRAGEILGEPLGSRKVHPNDHVNRSQSSNDVIPSVIHISVLKSVTRGLIPSLTQLSVSLEKKAKEFQPIFKVGRTHLQDATPIRLGQVFSGYAAQVASCVGRLNFSAEGLSEMALGGTAVGTGINCPVGFAAEVIQRISQRMGLPLRETSNHFAAQSSKDAVVEMSGTLRTTAVALMKIANDIRWLASGPRCGIGELRVPEVQPGSSIMPGKVNPVIPEALIMACAQVMGDDLTVMLGGQWGNFELNTMMPVMAHNILESAEILTTATQTFRTRCVDGLEADQVRASELMEKSLAMVTSLALKVGYDRAAEIAKKASDTGRTIREVARETGLFSDSELAELLDPASMTRR